MKIRNCVFAFYSFLNFKTGDLYFGGPTDLLAKNKIFVRNSFGIRFKRKSYVQTFIDNSKFLYPNSKFIYSFETTKYIYFVFKETAVEDLMCTDKIISRIGRVCKKDLGSKSSIGTFFNTFLKSKISCSLIKNNQTIYFNEIIDASFLSSDSKLFAIFKNHHINDATVCIFDLDDIEKQFNDAFVYQANLGTIWTRHEDPAAMEQFQCSLPKKKDELIGYQQNQRKYQIVDGIINNNNHFLIDNSFYDFKKIQTNAIKIFKTRTIIYIVYLITEDNQLIQFLLNIPDKKTCVLNQLKLPLKSDDKILKFKLTKNLKSIFIGSKNQLTKISISNCDNYRTETECLNSKDVYCVWIKTFSKCEYISNTKPEQIPYYKQPEFSQKCESIKPKDLELMYDKNIKCFIDDDSTRECQCNYDLNKFNPNPFKITACKTDGRWGEWTIWSACSNGKKYRTRKCDSPSPSNNGRECEGRSIEFVECLSFNMTDCSKCLEKCGNRIQTKKKYHLSKDEHYKFVDDKSCKLANCTDSNDSNQPTNYISSGWTECGATCGIGYQFKVCGEKSFKRKCDTNKKCFGWSEWSNWSNCTDGKKSKRRYCFDQDCKGEYKTTIVCSKNDSLHIEPECEIKPNKLPTTVSDGVTIIVLILSCILTFILGIIVGISVLFFYTNRNNLKFKRKSTKNLSLRSVSSPLIRADKNTYVTNGSSRSSSQISHNKSSINTSLKSHQLDSLHSNNSSKNKLNQSSSSFKKNGIADSKI